MRIAELNREQFDGYELVFSYTSRAYYDLRITNLIVQDGFRRRGYGSLLMTKAREIARSQGRRALILETQSCNTAAISFYLSQGFSFMGFNACEYSNQDLEKHEVRLEMGLLL